VPLPPRPVVAHARAPVSMSTTRYRHSMPYYSEPEPFYDLFATFARARSRSPPASPLPPRATPSPPTLHFPSSPPPGPTTLAGWNSNSSNDTGNEASQNSSSSSSERDLGLHDTEPGLTDATDENIVTLPHRRQNLISNGTHAVSNQVVAQLYSRHFSSRENAAAKSQEIAALFDQHFPDE
jgi:hypothetical protein